MTLAIGLMSGTSCDGISAALAEFSRPSFTVQAYRTFPYPPPLRALLHRARELTTSGISELNMWLGELLAQAALRVLASARVSANAVAVIGSHGHTVYHGPTDPTPSTLQLGEPAIIAERTGILVVANFRMRDIAAGGQGAPLVPAFDTAYFRRAPSRALQNIGGIANVTLVGRRTTPLAFDTGPGNCLFDAVARRISQGRLTYDRDGRLAARGHIDQAAIRRMWTHPYFRRRPPKSTGVEMFHEAWLHEIFGRDWIRRGPDVLATVTYFTAFSITHGYHRFIPVSLHEVIVSGGGALNHTLMQHLRDLLRPIPVRSSAHYGLHPQAKEAVAFAYLALQALRGRPNHAPATTGAQSARILGMIVPGRKHGIV